MKFVRYMPLLLTPLLYYNICTGQIKGNNIGIAGNEHYKTDTIINTVNIDNNLYKLEMLRAMDDTAKQELMVVIKKHNSNTIVYSKPFAENAYTLFKINDKDLNSRGRLFLEMRMEGGGSGFSGTCFEITARNSKMGIYPVYKLDELSLLYFKNDNEIIKLEGIWNFDENETHFSNHRYTITKYSFAGTKFAFVAVGKTKYKYPSLDEDKSPKEVLQEIKKNEPLLAKALTF